MPVDEWLEQDSELHEETLRGRIEDEIGQAYQAKADGVGGARHAPSGKGSDVASAR